MTFARLLLEIRRRAASLSQNLPRPMAIEQAARDLLQTAAPGEERDRTKQILAALLGIERDGDFDADIFGALTPEVILRLDMLLEDMLSRQRCLNSVIEMSISTSYMAICGDSSSGDVHARPCDAGLAELHAQAFGRNT